jgi:diguanylate cyclase (GGDEF)-like protein
VKDSRILVVDDIETNRFFLVKHLSKQGYTTIVEARDGQEAIDELEKSQIDLVLLDVMMPIIDGHEVLSRMKANKALRHIPVIMITALDDMDSSIRCIEHGAEDYILKPFNPILLQARVGACLEKKRLRDVEQEYLRSYDSATGLPNRHMLLKRLSLDLTGQKRNLSLFCVLIIRLGRYRMLIDSLSQAAGNSFVVTQAKRLLQEIPGGAFLARFSDNEFVVVLNDIDHPVKGNITANKIQSELEKSIIVKGHDVSGRISIGLAFSSTGYLLPEDILRDAGLAANRVNQSGVRIFDETMHREAMVRLELEPELRRAVEKNQLVLFFQPIVAFNSREVSGFEALIRWHHPEKGIVPPDKFIPLAEETGLIVPMGAWVFEEACRQAVQWKSLLNEKKAFTIGVNVSARQFAEGRLVETVRAAIDAVGLDRGVLNVEVTETLLIENPDHVDTILEGFKQLNVRTALDDFGTGYCSLSYLHRFPFDYLKIDQSFVKEIDSKEKNHKIVQSTIDLAHTLGMNVIAEGVETRGEAEELEKMGCEYGQGILFSLPLPAEKAFELLSGTCHFKK